MNKTTLEAADLRRALATAGDGAFVTGGDGRLTLWNRAAERILGYSARETVGKRCCDILAGFDERGNRLCYGGCHVVKLLALGESLEHFDMKTRGEPARTSSARSSTSASAPPRPPRRSPGSTRRSRGAKPRCSG